MWPMWHAWWTCTSTKSVPKVRGPLKSNVYNCIVNKGVVIENCARQHPVQWLFQGRFLISCANMAHMMCRTNRSCLLYSTCDNFKLIWKCRTDGLSWMDCYITELITAHYHSIDALNVAAGSKLHVVQLHACRIVTLMKTEPNLEPGPH